MNNSVCCDLIDRSKVIRRPTAGHALLIFPNAGMNVGHDPVINWLCTGYFVRLDNIEQQCQVMSYLMSCLYQYNNIIDTTHTSKSMYSLCIHYCYSKNYV